MEEVKKEFSGRVKPPFAFFIKKRIWLNILLFGITVLSTFFVGLSWSLNYKYGDVFAQNPQLVQEFEIFNDLQIISLSIIYAAVLMGILLAHEVGHFLTCRYNKIDATLPYFIPFPYPNLIGTLGAFIIIKSPITKKRQLFDIGVAGPLAGFILSLPALAYGYSLSKVVPSIPKEGTLIFGEPLILKIIGSIIFKDIPGEFDVLIHPMAFAGWVGILVTSLNLFPVGQLDGGKVSYALFGSNSQKLARFFLVALVIMGIFFWVGWFFWAVIILLLGLKQPQIPDEEKPLSQQRRFLGILTILVFILSFIPDPIKGYNLFDSLKKFGFW